MPQSLLNPDASPATCTFFLRVEKWCFRWMDDVVSYLSIYISLNPGTLFWLESSRWAKLLFHEIVFWVEFVTKLFYIRKFLVWWCTKNSVFVGWVMFKKWCFRWRDDDVSKIGVFRWWVMFKKWCFRWVDDVVSYLYIYIYISWNTFLTRVISILAPSDFFKIVVFWVEFVKLFTL